jgi:hypothetical protein
MTRPLDADEWPAVTPQPPGRTPHHSALRLPGGETQLAPGDNPRTPEPPEASALLSGAPPARRPAREANQ